MTFSYDLHFESIGSALCLAEVNNLLKFKEILPGVKEI